MDCLILTHISQQLTFIFPPSWIAWMWFCRLSSWALLAGIRVLQPWEYPVCNVACCSSCYLLKSLDSSFWKMIISLRAETGCSFLQIQAGPGTVCGTVQMVRSDHRVLGDYVLDFTPSETTRSTEATIQSSLAFCLIGNMKWFWFTN